MPLLMRRLMPSLRDDVRDDVRDELRTSSPGSLRWQAARLLAAVLLVAWSLGAPGSAYAEHAPHPGHEAHASGGVAARDVRLPAIDGRTLAGERLSTSAAAGRRRIVFCFNPGVAEAAVWADALARLQSEQTRANFAIVGVAMGLDPDRARSFATAHGLEFPILDDSEGELAGRLFLQSPLTLLGADPEGRVGLALQGFEHDARMTAEGLEDRVREFLRLPAGGTVAAGSLEPWPPAPAFEAERLDGEGTFALADAAGRPVVLVLFLSTCPHCHAALGFLREALAKLPEQSRPVLAGVALDSRPWDVEENLRERKLDFFPVLSDSGGAIATAYGAFGEVPVVVLIDAGGRIVARSTGWDEARDPDLLRMRLAALAGVEVPMALARDGYSGNDVCVVCHAKQDVTWRLTAHATAFDTLVVRGRDHDAKCVGCHVVGYGERGGYEEDAAPEHLQDVGCETCHGPGGGHVKGLVGASASAVKVDADYRAVCERCHDPVHSLGFDYATFLSKVSHAAIAALGEDARRALVAERDQPRDLLPTAAAYVGSDACRSCHEREYAIWSKSDHARSVESLRRKDKEDDAACIACHVTGYGRPGGFAEGTRVRDAKDLSRVGCESCHGPGGRHILNDGKAPAGILRLGDKCDSCVILQICGSCHDDDNDPGFPFAVEHRIEAQRHGSASR